MQRATTYSSVLALQGRRSRRRGRGSTRRPGQDQQVQPATPARACFEGGAAAQERMGPDAMRHTVTWLTIALQKEKEELDDISTELELADEDEKIQCALTTTT